MKWLLVLAVVAGPAAAEPVPKPDPATELPVSSRERASAPSDVAPAGPIEVVQAHASSQPDPQVATPPAPLVLRELVARDRFDLSLTTIASLDELALSVEVSGSIALGDIELFAAAPLIGSLGVCIEGCLAGTYGEAAFGNFRAGARYVGRLGPFALAPSVWGWLPTQTATTAWWPRARAVMTSVVDSRAFSPDAALGAAVDAAWRSSTAVVQAELGVALVTDRGPHVDNVFGALAASVQVTKRTSLLAEWRVDAYPHQPAIHAIGAGVGRGDPRHRIWRVRAHVVDAGELASTGMGVRAFELGFDLVQAL